ncbi:MAG: PAS domain S-box protein, partial [Desulfobacterales bacterium]|nr:PAS domain S-box protein [Desulfobacterales bacterium]
MKKNQEFEDGLIRSGASPPLPAPTCWKVLIVDDEEDVHTVTRLALGNFTFEGKPLKILDADSEKEGRRIFTENPDIAIVLLDVVMETETSGLDMVEFIRRDLGNGTTRIILRTGRPGQAPERKVIEAYDINDYKTKTELTSDNLFTIIMAGLRSYKAHSALESHGRELEWKVKERTAELAKSEAKYKSLFGSINSGVAVYEAVNDGADFVFVDLNRAGERIDNLKKEDLIGKSVLDAFPGIREFGLFDVFQRVWKTGVAERLPVSLYKDNRIFGWRDNFVYKLPSGEIVSSYTDETIRKQSEAALRESEDKFAKAFHSSPNLMAITSLKDGAFIDVNDSFVRTLEYDREELLASGSLALNLWMDPGKRARFIQSIQENGRAHDIEIRVRTKSGEIRSMLFSGEVIHINNQPHLITVASDITDRVRVEKKLRESEERMSAQFRAVPVPTYIWQKVDEEFILIDFNDAALKITDGKIDDFMGSTARELFMDESEILDGMTRCFKKKSTIEHEIHYRMKSTTSGKHLAIKYAFAPPDLVLIHTEDLTEKKRLQAEAIRAGHLASLGELAAGIAHEINNPINGIISYAELMKDQLDDQGEDDEIPLRIIKEGERVAKIVKNLLSFARDRKEESSPALIRDILADSLGLTESQINKDGVKFSLDIPDDLPKIRVRSQEIQQVFLNIISNARYALNQKFQGAHEDKTFQIKSKTIRIDGSLFIRTTFRDAGVGVPGEILGKISNPFFSTKPPGEGTGL